jgi:trans-2,3-dihydro-3-hydroxyanthranilate isomerase
MKRRRQLEFVQVDAFTQVPYGGNPAGVIFGADYLSEETILKIAQEMNVRETVFISQSKIADFKFRYLTPRGEISFSGHPTIAAFHALVESGLAELVKDVTMFTLETKAGTLPIEIVKNETTGFHEVQITHKRPEYMTTYDPKEYLEALGLSLADILSPNPVQTVSTGTPQLMIPLSSMKSLERIKPNWDMLEELGEDVDYTSVQVFTRDTQEVTSDAHARHFAPKLGVNEDPCSGSGAGNMASYMMKYGLMEPTHPVTSIVVEQGYFVGRPGKIFVEVRGDQEEVEQVKVSGTAVTTLEGKLYI